MSNFTISFNLLQMKFLKWLLFPFALLYGGIMWIRNFLYDRGLFKSQKFNLPVISVGNLTVGGTGKTPHVEYLLGYLQGYKTATLSRGYKRSTKGFVLAGANATATTIGDEPYQYFLDFPATTVAVSEKRAEGIRKIRALKPETEVILLDDAFQHRSVTPTLNLLLTDFYRRFDTDFMLPTGLLREPRSGARRADAVLVTKCPDGISGPEKNAIEKQIKSHLKSGAPVFFTTYAYGLPVAFGGGDTPARNVILVTGIANAEPLKNYLAKSGYNLLEHLNWPDHHHYTASDLQTIQQKWQQKGAGTVSVFTTRKDAVKLAQPRFAAVVKRLPFFYLPIRVRFLDGEAKFNSLVKAAITAGKPL